MAARSRIHAKPYVVAVDIGTSSVKVSLHQTRTAAPVGLEVRQPYQSPSGSEGIAELDADRLVRLVIRCLVKLLQRAGPRRATGIAAVGASAFWHGLVAADDSAAALTPLYLWSDTRSWQAADWLKDRLDPEQVRHRTGCPIHPSYWAAKLHWLHAQRPELWNRPVKWLSFPDLLYWRLFGKLGSSLSMLSGTGLLRLDDCQWDDELLSQLQIRSDTLPPVAEIECGLTGPFRRLLPQLADVPWVHAAGDGALANLGTDCISRANRALTIGTSAALRVMHAESSLALPQGLWRYRLDRTRLVTGGALSNGGNLRDWSLKTLRLTDERLNDYLKSNPPGTHGLTFLPHLAGERSMGYAAHATGAVAGLTSRTSAEAIAAAALESVAVELAKIDRALDDVLPGAKRLVASGNALLKSTVWMQMIADAVGRQLVSPKVKEASSRGAAIFAMERLGFKLPTVEDASPERLFQRNPEHAHAYRTIEARQDALYKAVIMNRVLERIT